MSPLEQVSTILSDTLGLGKLRLEAHTPLLGSLPELDSMAVAGVITALEAGALPARLQDELCAATARRTVPVLGVTQILAWGALFYPPVLTVPLIAAERGWSLAFTMGGLSIGLFSAGLIAPLVGRMIDRHGGHVVMTVG